MRKDRAEKRPDPAFGRWTHQPSLVMNRDKLFRGIFLIQREKRAFCVTTCNIKSISVEYVTLVTRVSPGKCRDV